MANVLYKTDDDTEVITVSDPPNPWQPNPELESEPPPSYPPPTPPPPPGSGIDEEDDDGWPLTIKETDEGTIICGFSGCTRT